MTARKKKKGQKGKVTGKGISGPRNMNQNFLNAYLFKERQKERGRKKECERERERKINALLQGVQKCCLIARLSNFSIKSWQSERRVCVATIFEQYTFRRSCVVRRKRNSPYSAGSAAQAIPQLKYEMIAVKSEQIFQ